MQTETTIDAPVTFTVEQAAQYLGKSPLTVRGYVAKGKLSPTPETQGRGRTSLFYVSDLEPLRNLWDALQERRAQKREVILSSGMRACTGCGKVHPLTEYAEHPKGIGGRHSRCGECLRASARAYAQRHRDIRIAYKRQYRQIHRDKVTAYKQEYGRRLTNEKPQAYYNLRGYFKNRYHLIRAIEDGKSSPICRKHGFALVSNQQTGEWRPARLDKPIATGERAVCHYKYGVADMPKWIVLSSPMTKAKDARLVTLLTSWESSKEPQKAKKRGGK